MAYQIPGGWSEPRALTDHDKEVFNKAFEGFVGVTYTPYEVATQVVNGTNYRFTCDSVAATLGAEKGKAEVFIYEALPVYGSKVVITDIQKL